MSIKQRDTWKEAILNDYPRLREIPHAIDTLIDLYEKNPEEFKKNTKHLEHKASKKKQHTEAPPSTPEVKVIEGAIEKIEAECSHAGGGVPQLDSNTGIIKAVPA
jgi:hypothetical protein